MKHYHLGLMVGLEEVAMKYTYGLSGVFVLVVASAACSSSVTGGGRESSSSSVGAGGMGTSSGMGANGGMGADGGMGAVGGGGNGASGGSGGSGGQMACADPPQASWSRAIGIESPATLGLVRVNANGAITVGGALNGTADFGGITQNAGGTRRVLLARLDAMGNAQWARTMDGVDDQDLNGMALDSSGHLLLGGGFYKSIDFGGGPLTTNDVYDGYVAKLDGQTGTHMWSKTTPIDVHGLAVDSAGNVLVAGSCAGSGGYDACVTKLDSLGNVLWNKQFGDSQFQAMNAVAVDASGNVLLAGVFKGSIDLGGGPFTTTNNNVFVAKLDPSGSHLWSHNLGAGRSERIRVDGNDNVYVAGGGDYIDFGAGPLGAYNFVVKLDPDGKHIWDKSFGILMSDNIFDMDVGPNGEVFVTGLMSSTEDFGGCPTPGPGSIFVSKLGADGTQSWTGRYGQAGHGYGLAVNAAGHVIVSGMFSGAVNFGAGTHTGAGDQDAFVVEFP